MDSQHAQVAGQKRKLNDERASEEPEAKRDNGLYDEEDGRRKKVWKRSKWSR